MKVKRHVYLEIPYVNQSVMVKITHNYGSFVAEKIQTINSISGNMLAYNIFNSEIEQITNSFSVNTVTTDSFVGNTHVNDDSFVSGTLVADCCWCLSTNHRCIFSMPCRL